MINKVTLIGNLGQDPECRTLDNGAMVGRFSLATNENYKDKDGNWQKQTEWHNVVVWRELAERCEKLRKGALVFVEGKISYRKYTDKDGVERNVTDIVAAIVRPLEKKEEQEQVTAHGFPEAQPRAAEQRQPEQAPKRPDDFDQLPF